MVGDSGPAGLAKFRQILVEHFSDGELRELSFDLGVEYDGLPGRGKGDRAVELIGYLQRRGRIHDLLNLSYRLRPRAPWQEVELGDSAESRPGLTTELPALATRANPFFVGGRINDPSQFFGRWHLIREIRAELKKRCSVVLVGPPGIGKSSLLYYLFATRNDWLPTVTFEYIDLQGMLDEADFCETILHRLGKPGNTLRDLKRALIGHEVILLLDEIERLAEKDFNPRLHDLLRSLAQEPHFAMCLAAQQPLVDLFPARTLGGVSPFHNIFTSVFLGPFTETEARAFLTARLTPTGIMFTPADIDRLLAESECHPAKLQSLAKSLFDRRVRS